MIPFACWIVKHVETDPDGRHFGRPFLWRWFMRWWWLRSWNGYILVPFSNIRIHFQLDKHLRYHSGTESVWMIPELMQLRFFHVIETKSRTQIFVAWYIFTLDHQSIFCEVHTHSNSRTRLSTLLLLLFSPAHKNVSIQFIRLDWKLA